MGKKFDRQYGEVKLCHILGLESSRIIRGKEYLTASRGRSDFSHPGTRKFKNN